MTGAVTGRTTPVITTSAGTTPVATRTMDTSTLIGVGALGSSAPAISLMSHDDTRYSPSMLRPRHDASTGTNSPSVSPRNCAIRAVASARVSGATSHESPYSMPPRSSGEASGRLEIRPILDVTLHSFGSLPPSQGLERRA